MSKWHSNDSLAPNTNSVLVNCVRVTRWDRGRCTSGDAALAQSLQGADNGVVTITDSDSD